MKRPATVVVLVEPSGTINVGSVARLCANFEVQELRLVSPVCDPLDPEACRMAVHGLELLRTARRCTSLLEAVADCRRVVASCGRLDHGSIPLHGPEDALSWRRVATIDANASAYSSLLVLPAGRSSGPRGGGGIGAAAQVLCMYEAGHGHTHQAPYLSIRLARLPVPR